jgi:lipopolysaccharide transport system permease protein
MQWHCTNPDIITESGWQSAIDIITGRNLKQQIPAPRRTKLSNIKVTEPQLKRTIIEQKKGWFDLNLWELWEYRELFWMLAMREVQLRYRQTFLGVTWVIIQPLLTTAIFTIIFGRLMNAPSEEISYELFAFAGLLPWNVFSQSLQRAGISLTRDIRLITRIFFPRIIIPMANAISTIVDFLVSLVVLIILLFIYRLPISINILTIPILLLLTLLISIGVGTIFSALNVYYRDFTYVLPFVIQVWMFASPLAYSSTIIPQTWGWVYYLNPIVGIIDGFRWAIFGTIDFPITSLTYSLIVGMMIFTASLIIFRRLERNFADVI